MKPRPPASTKTWSRKAILLVYSGMVLFWLGLAGQNGRLIIAGAIIFSFIILSVAFSSTPARASFLSRKISTENTLEEQPFQVETLIRNESSAPAIFYLTERLPATLEIMEGSSQCSIFAQPNVVSRSSNVLRADFRGHYVLPPPLVKTIDEFGLRERLVEDANATYISVRPPIEDVSELTLDTRSVQPEFGAIRSEHAGVGTEFFGIREYQSGDDTRRINWKASARTNILLSNEYERENIANVYLVVDLSKSSVSELRRTVRIAASIAAYLLRTRNRLGLIVLGEGIYHVRIESGRRQLLKVLDKLVTAEPGGSGERSPHLIQLAQQMGRSQVLVVSAAASEAIVGTVAMLSHEQENVTLIVNGPSGYESATDDPVLRAARLIQALHRRSRIQRIKSTGVTVVEIPPGSPLRTALAALGRRPLRR